MIEVENLSKLYRLGSIGSTTLRESVNRAWYRRIGKEHLARRIGEKDMMIPPDHPQAGPEPNTFWALKDVSFTVEQGEIVGIIGKNGAGKSTLLKILSRITEPTAGRAVLRGRVGSLLEVGTGFHPELTGRENIFLNGAILGMRRREIERKFDEIVAFAEVEKFIDTPVKRYSSGMYVRLAFAVAAHLEPEILLVDEVLAVGDAAFQKKCLGKMRDVSGEGRTVLFVSHNMAAVSQLCGRCCLVDAGRLALAGDPAVVISRHVGSSHTRTVRRPFSSFGLQLKDASFIDPVTSARTESLLMGSDYELVVQVGACRRVPNAGLGVVLRNAMGVRVSSICMVEEGLGAWDFEGEAEFRFRVPDLSLMPGTYGASVYIHGLLDPTAYLEEEDVLTVTVLESCVAGAPRAYGQKHGMVRIARGGYARRLPTNPLTARSSQR